VDAAAGSSFDEAFFDADLTCIPACGAHATCLVDAGAATCVCVQGYQLSGGACAWGTVPLDPGFQGTPKGAWRLEQGAVLDVAASGGVDPGVANLGPCALQPGRLRQAISMPATTDAEVFGVKVAASADCVGTKGNSCGPDLAVIINGGPTIFSVGSSPLPQVACLGERAYGGTFDLVVRVAGPGACTNGLLAELVDHLDIEPAPNCPAPGTLPDGDFDGIGDNWTTAVTAFTNTPPPVAEIGTTAGLNGTKAGHLVAFDHCQVPSIQGPISPPFSSIPNLALQFNYKGTAGQQMVLELAGTRIAVVSANGAQQTAKVCLTESNKGMTQTVRFSLGASLVGDLSCDAPQNEFVFDDLQFVNDPTCPMTAWIPDGGFEREGPVAMWEGSPTSLREVNGLDAVGVDANPANAHSGSRSLKLTSNVWCSGESVTLPVAVPTTTAAGGPALLFYYRAPTLTSSTVSLSVGPTGPIALGPSATYKQVQVCLDPVLAGRTTEVMVQLVAEAGGGDCVTTYPLESMWLDDFTVGFSLDCPAG
jgi:hypothetical protein